MTLFFPNNNNKFNYSYYNNYFFLDGDRATIILPCELYIIHKFNKQYINIFLIIPYIITTNSC